MAKKRRAVELFSLSFLDCICCGFGAMLLLFVLLIGRNANLARETLLDEIIREITSLVSRTEVEKQESKRIRERIQSVDQQIVTTTADRNAKKNDLTTLQDEFAMMLQQRSALKEEIDRLLGIKKNLPKQDEPTPLPIPNTQRRQYLSGFNFEGSYVVFMIETSGGMLGYTVDDALAKQGLPDEQKKKVEKWRRVVRAVHWIIANLTPRQQYQIVLFSKEAKPLLGSREEWIDPQDRDSLVAVLKALDEIVPRGGANLENAFVTVRETFPSVDSIVLITDSLPTLSSSIAVGSTTDDRDRERFFRAAIKEAPKQAAINTLLFPMSGDPACPYLFWQLAEATKGSLISPAPSWPDI